jgi:hypothetical protein
MALARSEPPARISTAPGFSLLRLSALSRVGGAAALVAGLWALVYWALR